MVDTARRGVGLGTARRFTWYESEMTHPVALLTLSTLVMAPGLASAQATGGSIAADRVGHAGVSQRTIRGITRGPRGDIQISRELGMIQTGLTPKFDSRVSCRGIDDYWAMDYSSKRGREAMHGGIDIPAPRGTPILAVAAGEVVTVLDDESVAQGIKIILRHSPQDTGHPFWVFTEYTHLLEPPRLPPGQRVRMGEPIAKTSNTGASGAEGHHGHEGGKVRRDAVHFDVVFGPSPKYYLSERYAIPVDGHWMDPNALYRQHPPFDSQSMKALPAAEKKIPIPYMLPDGTAHPPDAKLVWPYACTPR